MRNEIIDINGGTNKQFKDFRAILDDANMESNNTLEALTTGFGWSNLGYAYSSKTWCGVSGPITVTLTEFIKKYGKPKYSLGGIYEK